jgi:hypothetical protein
MLCVQEGAQIASARRGAVLRALYVREIERRYRNASTAGVDGWRANGEYRLYGFRGWRWSPMWCGPVGGAWTERLGAISCCISLLPHQLQLAIERDLEPEAPNALMFDPPPDADSTDRVLIQRSADLNDRMREILISWLNEVLQEFRLHPQVLHLAVALFDRYLCWGPGDIKRNRLQLIGVSAMLVAARYEMPDWFEYGARELGRRETIYAEDDAVGAFAIITNRAYTREEVVAMAAELERKVGASAELACTTSIAFLASMHERQREHDEDYGCSGREDTHGDGPDTPPTQTAAEANELAGRRVALLGHYFIELTLQRASFLEYSRAEVAAAALVLARHAHADVDPSRPPLSAADVALITGLPADRRLLRCTAELLKLVKRFVTARDGETSDQLPDTGLPDAVIERYTLHIDVGFTAMIKQLVEATKTWRIPFVPACDDPDFLALELPPDFPSAGAFMGADAITLYATHVAACTAEWKDASTRTEKASKATQSAIQAKVVSKHTNVPA